MPRQPAIPGLRDAIKKQGDAAGAVPFGEGCRGAMGPASGADRAALSEGWPKGWSPAYAA